MNKIKQPLPARNPDFVLTKRKNLSSGRFYHSTRPQNDNKRKRTNEKKYVDLARGLEEVKLATIVEGDPKAPF